MPGPPRRPYFSGVSPDTRGSCAPSGHRCQAIWGLGNTDRGCPHGIVVGSRTTSRITDSPSDDRSRSHSTSMSPTSNWMTRQGWMRPQSHHRSLPPLRCSRSRARHRRPRPARTRIGDPPPCTPGTRPRGRRRRQFPISLPESPRCNPGRLEIICPTGSSRSIMNG
jgi:hypothetical protein